MRVYSSPLPVGRRIAQETGVGGGRIARLLAPTALTLQHHPRDAGTLTFNGDLNSGLSASYEIDSSATLSLDGTTIRGEFNGDIAGTFGNGGDLTWTARARR